MSLSGLPATLNAGSESVVFDDATDIRIRYLAERPDVVSTLAEWFVAAWEPYYGANGPGDAETDLRGSMNRDQLPICLLAIDAAGSPLGTASLASASISHPELSPWVTAFLVAPDRRGRGVGTALVAAVEAEARRLGFAKLYISTDAASSIVRRHGWEAIDTAESLRGTVTVYATDL